MIAAYERELTEARQRAYAIAHERREEIKAETVDPHYPPSDPKSYPDTRGLDAWYPWL